MDPTPPVARSLWCRLGTLAAAGVVVAATACVYLNSLDGQFLFDDGNGIERNPNIQSLTPLSRAMSAAPEISVSGRPLVCLSLAINYHFGQFNVRGYHALNLAVHVLAALALWGVLRRTLVFAPLPMGEGRVRVPLCGSPHPTLKGHPLPRGEGFKRAATPLATAVAVLWAVHPIQTECVAYIVQRSESMVGLFYLLTLYCAIRGLEIECRNHPQANTNGAWGCHPGWRWAWYALAVVCCGLGMLCKEVMATAPVVVLLYDRIFAAGSFRGLLRRRWPLYAGLAATWAILAVLVVSGPRSETAGFGVANLISPWEYAATQVGVIAYYLRLVFWPEGLILQFDWPVAKTAGDILWPALVVLPLLAGTVVALVLGLRRPGRRGWACLAFLGVWFFVILAPSSSFVPIVTEIMAEHRMYLPLAAVIAFVVIGGYAVADALLAPGRASAVVRRAAAASGLVLVAGTAAALGWATLDRNEDYRTELGMWHDVERKCQSTWAAVNIGKVLYYRGQLAEAKVWYERALARDSSNATAHYNLGVMAARQGDAAGAIDHYTKTIRYSPSLAEAYQNLGVLYSSLGRLDLAEQAYRAGLEKRPFLAELHNGLGTVLVNRGDPDGAIACFRRALELQPNHENAPGNLITVLRGKGDIRGAVAECRQALGRQPDDAYLLSTLAFLLATCRDDGVRNGAEALALARRASDLTRAQDLVALEALAAAQAECGQFDAAVATVQAAIGLATARGEAKAATALQNQRGLYQARQPLRN